MSLSDSDRIARQRQSARIVDLWRALQPLRSVVSFMNSGAHPDDETSAMLAALGFRDGLSLSYACATRGEGGQNDIGTEATQDLGVLRTAEMERAAEALNMRLYWLGTDPDDSIIDFGFSKSGEETLAKWGADRTLARFVDIVRTEKPDILCPTFLDVPGQHGHHRAMTQMAHRVVEAAADADFPGTNLSPWQISKLYLPAWSGAGDAYDDDIPPPEETIRVEATGVDPITGWSWAQIGQQSRVMHRTQGMGKWVPADAPNDWPLHLAWSAAPGPDGSLTDGLPATLFSLSTQEGVDAQALVDAHGACMGAIGAFPDYDQVCKHAVRALRAIRLARSSATDDAARTMDHRLHRKEGQLARVIRIAAGVEVHASVSEIWLRPGDTVDLKIETLGTPRRLYPVVPTGWTAAETSLSVGDDALPTEAYPTAFDPDHPAHPAIRVGLTVEDTNLCVEVPFDVPPVVLPARSAQIDPDRVIINRQSDTRDFEITVLNTHPRGASADLHLPDGWRSIPTASGFLVNMPDDIEPGLYDVGLQLNGAEASTVRPIAHDHVAPRARVTTAKVTVLVLDCLLPDVRIGYVSGGNDRVAHWLRSLGLSVVDLRDDDLTTDGLARIDTLVAGIFTMRTRPALKAAMLAVHGWIKQGGTLLTLYHRPWDGWDPHVVPPRSLTIGKPSLRWRVTDETAVVTQLVPEHPILTTPNVIGPDDWAGWHKERGLYFAMDWDQAYTPLLSMADPGEEPHHGALLCADIGKGRHVHTSLILHHQLEKLVPGVFRLVANLVAKA